MFKFKIGNEVLTVFFRFGHTLNVIINYIFIDPGVGISFILFNKQEQKKETFEPPEEEQPEEEQSKDSELNHVGESIGYVCLFEGDIIDDDDNIVGETGEISSSASGANISAPKITPTGSAYTIIEPVLE